ncbi:ribonuclease H-like domain-containing protein [Tanacetum coccineum]
MESQSETTQTVSALKLPILKTGDYDLWSMRMEQYLTHTDYALWEVIVNGDAPAVASASAEGPIPPKTTEQKLARKNELKAKSTLLLAIPDEHLLKFHGIKDAKTLWEAIKARFGGNKESKKMQKTNANLKLLRSLPSAWNNITLIMRNKTDLETLSMDDLYNNLKVYEAKIKGQSSSSSHNVAFVSLEKTSSTNEAVNTAHEVSTASLQGQASSLTYDDVAMLTMRVKRFLRKTGRNLNFNAKETIGFDKTKVECYNCHRRGHFARECRVPRNQGNRNEDAPIRIIPVETPTNALVVQDGIGYQMGLESLEARIVVHEKNEVVYGEDIAFLNAKDKTGLGYDSQMNESEVVNSDVDDSPVNDRFKTCEGFHAVPPPGLHAVSPSPYTRNYMLRKDLTLSLVSKDSVEKPKTIRPSTPIIEDWDTDSDNDSVFRPKTD